MTDKIIPALGCIDRRLYFEKRLVNRYALDPCLMCDDRPTCVKGDVTF